MSIKMVDSCLHISRSHAFALSAIREDNFFIAVWNFFRGMKIPYIEGQEVLQKLQNRTTRTTTNKITRRKKRHLDNMHDKMTDTLTKLLDKHQQMKNYGTAETSNNKNLNDEDDTNSKIYGTVIRLSQLKASGIKNSHLILINPQTGNPENLNLANNTITSRDVTPNASIDNYLDTLDQRTKRTQETQNKTSHKRTVLSVSPLMNKIQNTELIYQRLILARCFFKYSANLCAPSYINDKFHIWNDDKHKVENISESKKFKGFLQANESNPNINPENCLTEFMLTQIKEWRYNERTTEEKHILKEYLDELLQFKKVCDAITCICVLNGIDVDLFRGMSNDKIFQTLCNKSVIREFDIPNYVYAARSMDLSKSIYWGTYYTEY